MLRHALIEITRKVEFDAGHRIPQHGSKCRNAHGHRYVLEATVTGLVKSDASKDCDAGMVQDFGDLKAIMMATVGEPWDHAFLVYKDDVVMREALGIIDAAFVMSDADKHRTVVLDLIPTVENLVAIAARKIWVALPNELTLTRVRLYETPNCWADWIG